MCNNRFLPLLFFVFEVGNVLCQNDITQVDYPQGMQHAIVREYKYPSTVSYVETATDHYFAYSDSSMVVKNIEFSHDIFVTDFEIHDQYGYFCGYNDVSGKGVWGWFDVSTIDNNCFKYHIFDGFECNGLYADSLFGLAVFEEQGQLHVVTVGCTAEPMTVDKWPCLIEIVGTEGASAGWNYQMGVSNNEGQPFHRLRDVCVTDNYVVAAGETGIAYKSEGYRVHLRSNAFQPGGPHDMLRLFASDDNPYSHNGKDVVLTHTDGDLFVSATHAYLDPSNAVAGVLVGVYDVAQMLVGIGATPAVSKLYGSLLSGGGFTIRGLLYSSALDEIALLVDGMFVSSGTFTGSVIAEMYYPALYAVSQNIIKDISLFSLDNYDGQHSLLSQGCISNVQTHGIYSALQLPIASNCMTASSTTTTAMNYQEKPSYCPFSVCSSTMQLNGMALKEASASTNIIICQ